MKVLIVSFSVVQQFFAYDPLKDLKVIVSDLFCPCPSSCVSSSCHQFDRSAFD